HPALQPFPTRRSSDLIAQALPGNRVVDISRAIQNYVEGNGFSVVREFVGHGVGRTVHEDPQVPNFVDGKCRDKLKPGMTIAIERSEEHTSELQSPDHL